MLVLCQDGSLQRYRHDAPAQLKYPKFVPVGKLLLGYEDLDQTRQIEVIRQANSSERLYGQSLVKTNIELEETIRGPQIRSEGQDAVTNVVYPVSASVNLSDNSVYIGDSVGQVHVVGVPPDGGLEL